jgi:hypothetical protein
MTNLEEKCIIKITKQNNVNTFEANNNIIYLDQMFVEKIDLEEYKKNTVSN